MSGLDRLLEALPRWTFVGGKGGVGKTTCAAALASRSAASGERTLLLSTDPAMTLADAIGEPLGATPRAIAARPQLHAFQLDALAARDAFLARWREVLISIIDRGTYLDRDDITGLVDVALPGVDEAMALLTLLDLEEDRAWSRIVVDTAPTGHTLRLLVLPETFRALIALLDVMQEKHRFMVRALTRQYRADDADQFLQTMRARISDLQSTLADPKRTKVVLVARAEALVVAETARYVQALTSLGIAIGAIVVNAVPQVLADHARTALAELETVAPGVPRYTVPLMESPPSGLENIDAWGARMREGPPLIPRRRERDILSVSERGRSKKRLLIPRTLTIVGGKGGVGKTTAACAIALSVAAENHSVLLVSTDPAPSVADALDQPVGDDIVPVTGAPGLYARQMDAAAAFARFRRDYSERVDSVFDSLMGGSLDAAHDRRIVRDLLAFTPPGIDELYALSMLAELLSSPEYATVLVDPAPTGHLLRLLEMPALALEWSHRLMRLTLKYKEVTGLGEAAQELLHFSRRTRALSELLSDPARAGMLIVALDEPLVRAETARLFSAVSARTVDVFGIIWNRSTGDVNPLSVSSPLEQFEAASVTPPPRGTKALRAWLATWRRLTGPEHG